MTQKLKYKFHERGWKRNCLKPQCFVKDRLLKDNYYLGFEATNYSAEISFLMSLHCFFKITFTFLAFKFHIWKSYCRAAFFVAITSFIIHSKSPSGFVEFQVQTIPFACLTVSLWTTHIVLATKSQQEEDILNGLLFLFAHKDFKAF